ncbi:MAG: hypothetical protein QXK78_05410 [Candidatus Bathyarchaeia archaeon]
MSALEPSAGRVAKYANLLYSLMMSCPFDPADRQVVERVIAWINSQPCKLLNKEDLKILVRKLVQYAKYSSCLISICGKTGVKRIPLVASYKLLLDWLMKHPLRDMIWTHHYGCCLVIIPRVRQ